LLGYIVISFLFKQKDPGLMAKLAESHDQSSKTPDFYPISLNFNAALVISFASVCFSNNGLAKEKKDGSGRGEIFKKH
jgi:hypothetical protein